MQKMYTPARIGLMIAALAAMLTVYVSALFVIQVYDQIGVDESQTPQRIITRRTTLNAARGNIYDRNGVLLASGRPSYNVKIDRRALLFSPDPNDTVQRLISAAMDRGLAYQDTFPVTRGAPFDFLPNMSTTQRNRLNQYMDFHNIDPDIPVSELLAWMRGHYGIDYTIGILEARLIIGVRYELEVRAIVHAIRPYIFLADVETDFVSYLEEQGLIGVYAESTFVREYHTSSAAHIIGYTGLMSPEEFEIYRERGYPMDAIVGKIGAELAFEEYLHGSPGEMVTRMTEDGTVVSVEVTSDPVPGKHVTLTLDLDLQIVTEHALRTHIERVNITREQLRLESDEDVDNTIRGGAVVVTNVNTGEILASATYPSFNLQTLSEDWLFLNANPNNPMLNRATHGRYIPGSTFKMVTALAGLRHIPRIGASKYYPIYDAGSFTKYADAGEGFIANCWLFNQVRVGHGWVHLTQAIEVSCNYYFIQVADWLPGGPRAGADLLAQTATEFGLGIRTGLEISESAGRLATWEDTWEARYAATGETGWFAADTIMAGFGQGENRFTPVQLANYAATIANGGTLYSLTILRMIRYSDFSGIYSSTEPEVLNVIEETEFIEWIQEGMVLASTGRNGTARRIFRDFPIVVASKTGTVQIEGRAFNDGVFVCYAPADNPQIAISIVVEKGGSGSEVMGIAETILRHYFLTPSSFMAVPYGGLVP